MNLPRILTIMGSGETAPTMVTTHRQLVSKLPAPVSAVVLDTPYGFQENAPELAARAKEYFKTSINIDIEIAGLVRLHDTHIPADPVQVERGLRTLETSSYVFAGPGSPTYALRQWSGSPVARVISDKLQNGGVVTFASAAALTLGSATVPVYEIYKVGQDVELLEGLNILGTIGINAAVIPHYDNAEGANHDTRFCYLGETRLRLFETMLPAETYVLGIDEHTALVIDLNEEVATVAGNGTVTLRLRGTSFTYSTGTTIPLAQLRNPWPLLRGESVSAEPPSDTRNSDSESASPVLTSLEEALHTHQQAFDNALSQRNADGAVRAALDLEQAITDWSIDTLQSDIADRARRALRSMISQLGDAAVTGVKDPRETVAPFVEAMLSVRAVVRAEKRFDLSDLIRDTFSALNIEVRDTPDGVEWTLPSS